MVVVVVSPTAAIIRLHLVSPRRFVAHQSTDHQSRVGQVATVTVVAVVVIVRRTLLQLFNGLAHVLHQILVHGLVQLLADGRRGEWRAGAVTGRGRGCAGVAGCGR